VKTRRPLEEKISTEAAKYRNGGDGIAAKDVFRTASLGAMGRGFLCLHHPFWDF